MNIVDRAIRMLTTPATEWEVVAAEDATTGRLMTGYAVPMSLLAHLAAFVGSAFVGAVFAAAFGMHRSVLYFLASSVVGWLLALAFVYVQAYVANALAPTFGSRPGPLNAFKLVVYASTAAWVGGMLAIIPVLGWLGALAGWIYSIYLFYLGLPRLMATPPDKVVPYMLVCAVVLIALGLVASAVAGAVAGAMFGVLALGGLHG